jgi:hypothetical protein
MVATENEIQEKRRLCEQIVETLSRLPRDPLLPDPLETVDTLAHLFLYFTEVDPHDRGAEHIMLATTEDAAVVELRERVGLPVPQGLVFVRYFNERDNMPPLISHAFQRPDTRAVTLLSRYIAVLRPPSQGPWQESWRDQAVEKSLSHELVHAYINSLLNGQPGTLPLWFHEGCAIFLSGSNDPTPFTDLVETPAGFRFVTYQSQNPEDYAAYERLFRYLQARLGRQGLYEQINRAVMDCTVDGLLSIVGASDETALYNQAEKWQQRRENTRLFGALAGLLILFFLFWRMLPKQRKEAAQEV